MLTKSEEEIMSLLWEVGEPLASSEIVSKSVDRTWRKSYINLLINSLLSKNMIKVVGVKQMTKNYARTFEPTMTKYAYSVKRIFSLSGFNEENIPDLFAEIIANTENPQILEKMQSQLDERKQELLSGNNSQSYSA
ncbi:BlaI/MecI/CopY family transcriptional regulator [Ruminococcus sp.]|uniref:BlaI/MecI/CopY family transcriptional regulator n=1 Tax=Ruminococcus sp. TaxID=41978 RepID=UPI003520AA74